MFTPHHITNHDNKYGAIFNKDETLWCGWCSTQNQILVWNDPFTQHIHLSNADLEFAKLWLLQELIQI